MIKFNLEKALNGAKVITREGREVSQLIYFGSSIDNIHHHYFGDANEIKLYVSVDGQLHAYSTDGRLAHSNKSTNPLDLFMAPEMIKAI